MTPPAKPVRAGDPTPPARPTARRKGQSAGFASRLAARVSKLAEKRFQFCAGVYRLCAEALDRCVKLRVAMFTGELRLTAGDPAEEFVFRYVPAGTTRLGLTDTERLRVARGRRNVLIGHNAQPAVEARFLAGFFLLDREVTQGQYRAIAGEPKPTGPRNQDVAAVDQAQTRDVAQALVSWNDADEFCRRLRSLTGFNARLPSEWEWEYAARGPRAALFADGDDPPQPRESRNAAAGYAANVGHAGPAAGVCCLQDKSWCGVYDLSGNLSEWCQDEYFDAPLEGVGEPVSLCPAAPAAAAIAAGSRATRSRVVRGASFDDHLWDAAAPLRKSLRQHLTMETVGFRPAILVKAFPALEVKK